MANKNYNYPYTTLLGSVGFLSGIVYSFYKKTGFWKGFGIAIIGNIALGGVGYGIDKAIMQKKTSKQD